MRFCRPCFYGRSAHRRREIAEARKQQKRDVTNACNNAIAKGHWVNGANGHLPPDVQIHMNMTRPKWHYAELPGDWLVCRIQVNGREVRVAAQIVERKIED